MLPRLPSFDDDRPLLTESGVQVKDSFLENLVGPAGGEVVGAVVAKKVVPKRAARHSKWFLEQAQTKAAAQTAKHVDKGSKVKEVAKPKAKIGKVSKVASKGTTGAAPSSEAGGDSKAAANKKDPKASLGFRSHWQEIRKMRAKANGKSCALETRRATCEKLGLSMTIKCVKSRAYHAAKAAAKAAGKNVYEAVKAAKAAYAMAKLGDA